MEYKPLLILITLAVVLAGIALSAPPKIRTRIFDNTRARLIAAITVGLGVGYIFANPLPVIEVAMQLLPILLLYLYVTAAIKIKRGLSIRELTVALMLIACGIGYYAANRRYATSATFALAAGVPVGLSIVVRSLLKKYQDSSALVKLRKTKFYRILQTDLKL